MESNLLTDFIDNLKMTVSPYRPKGRWLALHGLTMANLLHVHELCFAGKGDRATLHEGQAAL